MERCPAPGTFAGHPNLGLKKEKQMRKVLLLVLLLAVAVGLNSFAEQPTKLTLWTFQPLHLDFFAIIGLNVLA